MIFKKGCVLAGLISLLLSCQSSDNDAVQRDLNRVEKQDILEVDVEKEFDAELASRYGADDYGMKQYVIAFLRSGPNQDWSEAQAEELQRGHMANIKRMAAAGELILAGPFMDDGDLRGIYIFNVTTVEEAQSLTETDPAIQAGSLVMELKPWYGSAALMGVSAQHERLSKVKW